MKKKVQIPLYPRKIWLIDSIEDLDGFTFYRGGGNWTECPNSKEEITQGIEQGHFALLTHAVADENDNLGVIVYVDPNMDHDVGSFAHEAVHVADYVFDELGMMSQSYDDCNEPYAYLVGWIANKIKKYYDSRRKQEPMED